MTLEVHAIGPTEQGQPDAHALSDFVISPATVAKSSVTPTVEEPILEDVTLWRNIEEPVLDVLLLLNTPSSLYKVSLR